MEIICPRCGFTNKHQGVRCECCLAELASAPGPSVSEAAPPPGAAPAALGPSIPPGRPDALSPQRSLLGQPPPLSPEIAKGSGAVIAGLMVIGLLGGLWMMRPQPGQARIKLNFGGSGRSTARPFRQAAPSAQAPAPPAVAPLRQPAPAAPGAPAPAPASQPAPAPAAAAVPQARREEQAAEAQFKTALSLLQRKQTAPARQALQDLAQKYPNTKSAREGRALLSQIPEERQAAQAAARPVVPPAREPAAAKGAKGGAAARTAAGKPAASGAGAAASAVPAQAEQSRRVFTSDDLAAGRVSGATALRRTAPSIPPSLQSSQVSPSQGVKAAVLDDLRLLRASYESGQWTVEVEYNLVSTHARPVYLGAWMTDATVSRRLGYTAAPMSSGRATARVVLPGVPPTASKLRVVFFEEKGALFFTRDLIVSK